MYFDTSMHHIASSASSKNMGSRAHFNTMCFLFTGIMAADANQLQDLRNAPINVKPQGGEAGYRRGI